LSSDPIVVNEFAKSVIHTGDVVSNSAVILSLTQNLIKLLCVVLGLVYVIRTATKAQSVDRVSEDSVVYFTEVPSAIVTKSF